MASSAPPQVTVPCCIAAGVSANPGADIDRERRSRMLNGHEMLPDVNSGGSSKTVSTHQAAPNLTCLSTTIDDCAAETTESSRMIGTHFAYSCGSRTLE